VSTYDATYSGTVGNRQSPAGASRPASAGPPRARLVCAHLVAREAVRRQ